MKTERRSQKEMNVTREMVYESFNELVVPEHKFLGRTSEGLVYENEQGLAIVLRVVVKQLDFLAEEEIEDFENKAMAKIEKELAKENKLAKLEKAKAEKLAKAKAEKETEEGA